MKNPKISCLPSFLILLAIIIFIPVCSIIIHQATPRHQPVPITKPETTEVKPSVSDIKVPVEIESWRWISDPNFAGDGAIKWMGVLKNNTDKYISNVKVELIVYDKSGKITTTDSTYSNPLAPSGTAAFDGYADYYGTEDKAGVRIIRINYSY
ncbi:hypothetical protein ES705_11375 [subsurface metagenome]